MGLLPRRTPSVSVPLEGGERVLATAPTEPAGHVVATNHRFCVVDGGGETVLAKPWHLVDTGSLGPDGETLSATWVDGTAPGRWTVSEARLFLQTFRERVQASVVLAETVRLGPRQSVRAVIRADLATGDLIEQVVPHGVDPTDPGVAERIEPTRARLREQVGL